MFDPIKFLHQMAAHYGTTVVPEQEKFVRRFQKSIDDGMPLLLEADGGIGKTIGYLDCAMGCSLKFGKPIIIATSTTSNRDQIEADYNKIIEFAKESDDQDIAALQTIPFLNYRSVRDYASPARVAQIIRRYEKLDDAPIGVLAELRRILACLNVHEGDDDHLVNTVMPDDLTYNKKVIVKRDEISARLLDKTRKSDEEYHEIPSSYKDNRNTIESNLGRPCILVMTQVMLARSWKIRKMIRDNMVSIVVIDEVDKLTTTDFVTFSSFVIDGNSDNKGVVSVLDDIEAVTEIDTTPARDMLVVLRDMFDLIRPLADDKHKNVAIVKELIGENRHELIRNTLRNFIRIMEGMTRTIRELPATRRLDENAKRWLCYTIEELIDEVYGVNQCILPSEFNREIIEETYAMAFLSWDDGFDDLRSVSARPGALIRWLFYRNVTIPILLTTAFLGESDRQFAWKIGLPFSRLNRENAIRAIDGAYGDLNFVFFQNLAAPTLETKNEDGRYVNPDHLDDIGRLLTESPWAWTQQNHKGVLVLSPGYDDIEKIEKKLRMFDPHMPLFVHQKGSNINKVRDGLLKSVKNGKGGVLLTVYWEGFNVVQNDVHSGRRSVIDTLVITRIPFPRPNPVLQALRDLLSDKYTWWWRRSIYPDMKIDVKRRVHQGMNRAIRGPVDKATLLICDTRFPYPPELINKYGSIMTDSRHMDLLETIPERFRGVKERYTLVDGRTWEEVPV